MNLNLGKFKKIKEDAQSAVLKHPDGHEIRISKKILSPAVHQELKKLPMHLSEGGEVDKIEEPLDDKDKYLNDIENEGPKVSTATKEDYDRAAYKKAYETNPEPLSDDPADRYQQEMNQNLQSLRNQNYAHYPEEQLQKQAEGNTLSEMVDQKESAEKQAQLNEAARLKSEQLAQTKAEEAHQHDVDYIRSQNIQRAKLGLPTLPLPVSAQMMPTSTADASANQPPMMPPSGQMPQTPAGEAPVTPQGQRTTSIQGPDTPVIANSPIIKSDLTKPYDTAMAGVQNQLAATEGLGKVEAEQNRQNAALYNQNVVQQQAEQKRSRDILDTLHQEHQAFMEDYKNQHIDPTRYLNSMGTQQKMSTAFGLILGGMGGAENNTVSKFIDSQIQNDIKAQEAEMSKKHNLLAANFQEFGNMKQASEMYQAQTKSILADQLLAQAAKSGSQSALLNAQNVAGKLQYEASQHLQSIAFQQMAQEQMKQTAASGAPAADKIPQLISNLHMMGNHELAKSYEAKYVPGVGLAQVPVPEAARTQIQTRQNLDNKINELIKFTKENQGTTWDRAKVKQGEAMVNLLTDAYRQANNQGVFKESEKNFVGSFLKQDPTAFFASFRTLPGYDQVHRDNLETLNSLKKSVGLPTTFVPSSAQAYKGR